MNRRSFFRLLAGAVAAVPFGAALASALAPEPKYDRFIWFRRWQTRDELRDLYPGRRIDVVTYDDLVVPVSGIDPRLIELQQEYERQIQLMSGAWNWNISRDAKDTTAVP